MLGFLVASHSASPFTGIAQWNNASGQTRLVFCSPSRKFDATKLWKNVFSHQEITDWGNSLFGGCNHSQFVFFCILICQILKSYLVPCFSSKNKPVFLWIKTMNKELRLSCGAEIGWRSQTMLWHRKDAVISLWPRHPVFCHLLFTKNADKKSALAWGANVGPHPHALGAPGLNVQFWPASQLNFGVFLHLKVTSAPCQSPDITHWTWRFWRLFAIIEELKVTCLPDQDSLLHPVWMSCM